MVWNERGNLADSRHKVSVTHESFPLDLQVGFETHCALVNERVTRRFDVGEPRTQSPLRVVQATEVLKAIKPKCVSESCSKETHEAKL